MKNRPKELKMNRCKYCKSRENLTVDHKIARINGGSDELKNLQCLCRRCNTMKSGLDDKRIRSFFNWFLDIQKSRFENGSKVYHLH